MNRLFNRVQWDESNNSTSIEIRLILMKMLMIEAYNFILHIVQTTIVVRKSIYIIFVILYVISLLDFITLSCVWFWLDIYITFVFIFIIYRLLHLFYTFVFVFVIVATCCLHNVHIHHLAIYLLMNLSYHIWLLHLITIFNICCCYL